jgi:hypothetical protein
MLAAVMRGGALVLGLLSALAVTSTASGAALPGVVADGGTVRQGKNIVVRPKQIVYTGDGSGFFAVGVRVFTRMRVRYTHGPNPFTHKRTETFTLRRAGPQLFWNIPR